MSRKNISKLKAKKTINKAKNQKKAKTSSSIRLMEKEFKNMPAKLIQQLRKETAVLKKQESSINSSLKKLQKQKNVITNQQTILLAKSQEKQSASLKKQLLAIKKHLDKMSKGTTTLTSELERIQHQLSVTSEKRAQLVYLSKEITQLDKRANLKSSKPSVKPRKKLKSDVQPLIPQNTAQPIEDLIDSTLSQTTEMES